MLSSIHNLRGENLCIIDLKSTGWWGKLVCRVPRLRDDAHSGALPNVGPGLYLPCFANQFDVNLSPSLVPVEISNTSNCNDTVLC